MDDPIPLAGLTGKKFIMQPMGFYQDYPGNKGIKVFSTADACQGASWPDAKPDDSKIIGYIQIGQTFTLLNGKKASDPYYIRTQSGLVGWIGGAHNFVD